MNSGHGYQGIFNVNTALKNEKIEDKLNVICVISNPCNYKRRYELTKLFISDMLKNKDVNLYVVECIYPKLNQTYVITDSTNPNHLQLTAETILWTKENMINIAVSKLLPKDYKAFAFIDSDLKFINVNWAEETLRILNSCDILQLFTDGYNLDKSNMIGKDSKQLYSSLYVWINKNPLNNNSNIKINKLKPHQGWAWAITRTTYEKINGIYDLGIIGGGDSILVRSITEPQFMFNTRPYKYCSVEFKKSLFDYQSKFTNIKLGYTPGTLLHYYHGSLDNRKYVDRWKIIIHNNYNPYTFIKKNNCGMYEATIHFPELLKEQIIQYFVERNEDN
jgi:hypothetical protein